MPLPKRVNFTALQSHGFSSSSSSSATAITTKTNKPFQYIKAVHRDQVIAEAQKSIRVYLSQSSSSLPFFFADLIATNAPFSLSNLFAQVRFSKRSYSSRLNMALRYEPINEFEFFFESIGIDFRQIPGFLPPKTLFLSEDTAVLHAAGELYRLGFPWNMLGKLYIEDASIFRKSPAELEERLSSIKQRLGSDNLSVVGACLAFPYLLSAGQEFDCDDTDTMLNTLKRFTVELGVKSGVERNVDALYEVCCKVRFFYNLGCDKGKVDELMCKNIERFTKCPIDALPQKFDYFLKFGAEKIDVGMFILHSPEILSLDLETPVIQVLGLLRHFGLDSEKLQVVAEKYPYILGRNEMANLPCSMKALDLHDWSFNMIRSSSGRLLATYSLSSPYEGMDEGFADGLKKFESGRCAHHVLKKLSFLKEIGFGENDATIRTLKHLKGVPIGLHTKFNFLIQIGIKHSDACSMVRRMPLLFSLSQEKLEMKMNYLLNEMGLSADFVVYYPQFLTLHLEQRIKPRYGFYRWLQEMGWRPIFNLSGMLYISEADFIRRLYQIHPATPKQFLARFY